MIHGGGAARPLLEEDVRLALAATAALSLAAAPAGGRIVTVEVSTFRSTRGVLECSLWTSPHGFPSHPETAAAKQRTTIRPDRTGACRFEGLAPGEYAVAVMHDENGNGKMDFGLFGIPREGYGFSNNHTHALSAPTWEESRFRVGPGDDPVLEVRLKY